MNTVFATTVAVAVPVILLALGGEARELDARTRPQRNLFPFVATLYSEAEQALESFPDASPDWTVEQTRTQWANYQRWVRARSSFLNFSLGGLLPRAYLTTLLWALTIASLIVTEVWTLVWLTTHHPDTGDWSALAWLSVISCALGMVLLLTVPTLRLLWLQVPSFSDPKLPGSFRQIIERKFGLPADASEEERQRWLDTMNRPRSTL